MFGSYLLSYLENKVGSSPVVVCGDFNADPKEPIYAAFKESALNLQSSNTNL
jgi:endonuclease/exonuclease/phosphatase family metal-dependent hydrolase